MTPNALNHKTLLKSLQKHCQMVFSRFLATTLFIPAEKHSEFPGHICVFSIYLGRQK
jgi:hypothetical protein